jgi:beta-xylosidase
VVAVVAAVVLAGPARTGGHSSAAPAWRTAAADGVLTGEPSALPSFGAGRAVEYDDVGDPFVLSVPGGIPGDRADRYVLFWTTDWRSNVPTAVSSDMVHWHRVADGLPVLPSWAVPSRTMTWGPSAQKVPGGWDLYFSTLDASNHLECIGSAFSTSPIGPYTDRSSSPLVCQRGLGGDIDPSVVHDGRDSVLVWKSNGNAAHRPVGIWTQRLSPSGLQVAGRAHRLLGAGETWEHGIVEGPSLLAASHGGWWLFYSGGSWRSDTYDTGVAWCATVVGPCHPSKGPVLSSRAAAVSPGGLDTFRDAHGRLWASYSVFPGRPANSQAAVAEDRVLEIAPVLSH